MNKRDIIKQLAAIMLIVCIFNFVAYGQEMSREEIEASSIGYFKNGDYQKAVGGFEGLVNVYPKEPSFNYYLGVCYLNLNISPEKAIDYIRYSAAQNYKVDAHFYLFRAYLNNYMFDEARISLVNFENLAFRKEEKKVNLPYWKEVLDKVVVDVANVPIIDVVAQEEISSRQICKVYGGIVQGEFIPKPTEFLTDKDKAADYQGLTFIPDEALDIKSLFVAGKAKKKKNGIDLFLVKRLEQGKYADAADLESLNTEYDEQYPYFDHVNKVLYFSSNRIGGVGGYDIYKSVFDETSRSFKEPERLGFPINTPYDDFLYVPDEEGEMALFLSNREVEKGSLKAYKIKRNDSPRYETPKNPDEIALLAALKVKEQSRPIKVEVDPFTLTTSQNIVSEYEQILGHALDLQLMCDSIQSELIQQKNQYRVEHDAEKRLVLQSEIVANEQKGKTLQDQADELFSKARKIRDKENNTAKNENIKLNKQIGDLKVFNYDVKQETQEVVVDDEGMEEKKAPLRQNDSFDILAHSPYSFENPIPLDARLPEGLIYKIQLGAYGRNISMDRFKGLTPMSAESIEGKTLTRYFVGLFRSSKEARKALGQVRGIGYKDAFLVPYFNGDKISIQKARDIEFGGKYQ